MAIQINRGLIGKEYPPYPVTVERGKIKEFARPPSGATSSRRRPSR